ncbi:MAG TPA: GAF domain-containing protein, partial [Pseudonocardia sp.]|nr:GAF domain-containing protein [Pseudonocardia sp.]
MAVEGGERAESTADRLRSLEAVTGAELAHLSADELLAELLDRVHELLGADTAAVLLLDPSSQYLVATAALGLAEEVHQGVRIPVGLGFAGRVAAERRPLAIDRVDEGTVINPILWERGIHSLLGAPLLAGGEVL